MPQNRSKTKASTRSTLLNWLLPLGLLAVFLAMRVPALGRFVTTDEALWLRRSANFYLAVSTGGWANTFQSEHPGIVTQWAGAAGFWLKFPDYAHIGEPEVHDAELLRLMENRGVNPMEVLGAGRLVLVLLHAAAFAAAWPFARRLLGQPAAAAGLALIALDPFTIAHQRLLHLDGLLASFMLLSVLAFLDFLDRRRITSLIVSALAAGLTLLTKTPGWFLLPFVFGLSLWKIWQEGKKRNVVFWIRNLALWSAVALLVLFVFFPAMWAAPIQILQKMFAYAQGSAQGEFSGPLFFNGQIYPNGDFGAAGWIFYPLSFLWRSTPLTLIGLILAIYVVTRNRKSINRLIDLPTIEKILIFALLFMFFMTLGDKKFDRYLLPALPPLLLIAGWGWARFMETVRVFSKPAWGGTVLLGAVVALQFASALPTFPYYLSYYDPMMGGSARAPEVMQIGWGEGLDQAANYLKQRPSGSVAAWYSTSLNLLFNSEADDIPILTALSQTQLDSVLARDYLVLYIHQWQRGTPQNLLDNLEDVEPEYRVVINGIEYVRVYHLEH